jgi:dTDP-4-amino-4,6-dideoxygalactose transaminase
MLDYENLGKLNFPFIEKYKLKFKVFLESGWYILGQELTQFEEKFATYCGAKYCAGVANGLDALTLALRACDFPEKSEIIVPANTYIATILAILNAGHIPVLVEPNIRTYNIDEVLIAAKITAKTRAIMPVHLYGRLCNMPAILEIAAKHGLKVIEDAAQAHGAALHGRKAGAWGDITAFSFYPTKNLGALGDGGAITTDNLEYWQKIRTLRNYGSQKKYYNEVIGVNSRLDELQAVFLQVKLEALDQINSHKNRLAEIYHTELPETKFIKPIVSRDYEHVYHIYNIRHPDRERLKTYLENKGIKTEIHYPIAPNQQPALRGIFSEQTPLAEEIHRTTLSLPISFCHTEQDILTVCRALKEF